MLIWINGAFGAGKTHTAFELHRRLPGAHVADPEPIGFALNGMLPPSRQGDFQDLPQWRSATVMTLHNAEVAHRGPVLVPMTIVREDYFEEIIGGLRALGVDVRHYTLVASAETLERRLRHRLSYVASLFGDDTWALGQVPRCVAALTNELYATHVPTDDRSIHDVVEWIARDAGLPLRRPRLSPMRYQARRVSVGIRHIRL